MKRITIKDIARELGIHHSTVSRALRGSLEINAITIEKVMRYASERGYQINRNALFLRGSQSNIIGVIVPNIHHSFFSNFVSIVTKLASASGYMVAVFQSEESVKQEKEIVKSIIQQNIAGVISSLSMETSDVSHFQQLDSYKIPFVCFDRISPLLSKSAVILDNEAALKNVVIKLHSKGFKKMAYLSGVPSIHLFKERQKGYLLGLKEINSKYENCIAITEGFSIENGFEVALKLFNGKNRPDALIFDSHVLAWGALNYLKTAKKELFPKIGIASFGGYPWLSLATPNALVIQQPEEKMAEASFNLLMENIKNPDSREIITLMFQVEIT